MEPFETQNRITTINFFEVEGKKFVARDNFLLNTFIDYTLCVHPEARTCI